MRILFAGDSLNTVTGLSYIAVSLMRRFSGKGYEVAYVTISGPDTTLEGLSAHGDNFAKQFNMLPLFNAQLLDEEKYRLFDSAIETFRPHIVISVHNPWHLDQIAYSDRRKAYFWTAYVTIETTRYPEFVIFPSHVLPLQRKSIKHILQSADLVIPTSPMGELALENMGLGSIEFVYPGVDFDQRSIGPVAKKKAFGQMVSDDDFMFMTMGINSERKKLDKVIEAFSRFRDILPKKCFAARNYWLYVHTDVQNIHSGGTDLPSMIRGLGLQGHVIFPGSHFSSISSGDKGTKGIQRELLFSRYRASDVYVSLPAGEGFGYGFAEAMMHGLPVIYTEYGGHVAYCHGHGIAVSPKGYFRGMNSDIEWAIADYSAAAQAMVKLATNRSLRKTLGERAEKAAGELFDWEVTFPEFERRVLEAYEKASAHSLYTIMQRRIL